MLAASVSGSLNDVSSRLAGLGRREEALTLIREVVALYRELAEDSPEEFRPRLAGSLTDLAALLTALGREAEAEAVPSTART